MRLPLLVAALCAALGACATPGPAATGFNPAPPTLGVSTTSQQALANLPPPASCRALTRMEPPPWLTARDRVWPVSEGLNWPVRSLKP